MAHPDDRLRRLLDDQLGECSDADVERRKDELHALAEEAPDRSADVAALSALANDTRYRIVRLLSSADGELCVCELAPLVAVSDSALSHALSDLTNAGLLARSKDGKWRYYVTTDRAEALLDALDATREVAE
ncbi:ArsR/SmtB family transcription factor [Halorussus amylolyticus]|uniref:ArsR/SmtB family transcription factor n=1 Tax=Halorussus amylolyticus TaxID=1126242 RepID=UPI00104D671B|nr:metalloregulator ArsR/SmtB family transcription factor [Halorussus amylolyticus]